MFKPLNYNMLINTTTLITTCIMLIIILASTPLNIGMWIILTTLIITILISILISSWFSLTLFLIYIGGLLVIFAYFVAIQPNQQIKIIKIIFTLLITTILFYPLSSTYKVPQTQQHASKYRIIEILTLTNVQILLLLAIVLFLALIAVVKITNIHLGPLRPFKYVFSTTKNPSSNQNYK